MLIVNSSKKIDLFNKYLLYLDTDSKFCVYDSTKAEWVDIINNGLETKVCFVFDISLFSVDSFQNELITKIELVKYQNIEKSFIFYSEEPLKNLPINNNLTTFIITNNKNENDQGGVFKRISDDDFYLQLFSLLNIINDCLKDFSQGSFYGITSCGFFYNQVNEVSEILSSSVLDILSEELPDKVEMLYDKFLTLKNNLERQHDSFSKQVSFERVFGFEKNRILSKIDEKIGDLWKGKLLERLLERNLNHLDFRYGEQMIGATRKRLINTINELIYYPHNLIFDYDATYLNAKKEFAPSLKSFAETHYLKYEESRKRLFIGLCIWFGFSLLILFLISNIFSFALVSLSIVVLLIVFFSIPRYEFKKALSQLYTDIEDKVNSMNVKYSKSNREWIIAFVRTQVEKLFEEINPKYGETLEFLDTIPPNKIFNFLYNYWDELKSNEINLTQDFSKEINERILKEDKKNLHKIFKEYLKSIAERTFNSKNDGSKFWSNQIEAIVSKFTEKSYYLSSKNLLVNIDTNSEINIVNKNYWIFIPNQIRKELNLNFAVYRKKFLNSKNMFFLSLIEKYSQNKI